MIGLWVDIKSLDVKNIPINKQALIIRYKYRKSSLHKKKRF